MNIVCAINNKMLQDNSSINYIMGQSIKKEPYSIKVLIAQLQHIWKMILIMIMIMMMMIIRV